MPVPTKAARILALVNDHIIFSPEFVKIKETITILGIKLSRHGFGKTYWHFTGIA